MKNFSERQISHYFFIHGKDCFGRIPLTGFSQRLLSHIFPDRPMSCHYTLFFLLFLCSLFLERGNSKGELLRYFQEPSFSYFYSNFFIHFCKNIFHFFAFDADGILFDHPARFSTAFTSSALHQDVDDFHGRLS